VTLRVWSQAECEPWHTAFRPARAARVLDGDTLELLVDLGYDVRVTARVRLVGEAWLAGQRIGFDAPELASAQGKAAWLELGDLVRDADLLVRSWRGGSRDGFGRWLALVLVPGLDGWYSAADHLLERGLGRAWWRGIDDGKPRPGGGDA
jgi:hypothetical protein